MIFIVELNWTAEILVLFFSRIYTKYTFTDYAIINDNMYSIQYMWILAFFE